jgi:hypothetical protein
VAYVPAFDHDIFISYCHGDDRPWIRNFYERLNAALKEQLGVPPAVWIDEETLEKSQDYRRQIPQSVLKAALFLFLPSNQYVRSRYCVESECAAFETTIPQKRARFDAKEFQNQLFAFRAPILPVDKNEHWDLFPGLTDYNFHNGRFRLPISTDEFAAEFGRLVLDIAGLLKRMRNHSTKVFLYPRDPGQDIAEAHAMLRSELLDHGYCVLPDSLVAMEKRMLESALAIFLLGETYDSRMLPLVEAMAKRGQQPWVVWESPSAHSTIDPDQQMLPARIEQRLDSPGRRYFNSKIRPDQLKRDIMELLKPAARIVSAPGQKRRVALIYDPQKREELVNAGDIRFLWNTEFDFDLPSGGMAPAAARSDAILLIWGNAEEAWASYQFERLIGLPGRKGLCVFDPEKRAIVEDIRRSSGHEWHISEHYGQFVPDRLDPFFDPLRQHQSAGDQA